MRYEDYADLGGFFWWVLIKFCKTSLEEEQTKENWSRNIIFLIFIGMIIALLVIRVF